MTRILTVSFCALLVSAAAPSSPRAAIENRAAPEVAGIVPGTSRRAEVELKLGETTGQRLPNVFSYRAPSSLEGAQSLRVEYYPDQRVARVDVDLTHPLAPQAMDSIVGTRVHQETDEKGRLVEYFFPSLLALVREGSSAGSPIAAIAYLSPHKMTDAFCERANNALRFERFDDMLTECDKAVLLSPEYARGYRCRAIALSKSGRMEAALEQWLAATQAAFGERYKALAASEMAEEFQDRGWKDRAYQALADAKRFDSSSPIPHLTEARLLQADKQANRAAAAYREAAERAGDDRASLALAAAGLYELERYADAAPYYEKLADLNYGDPFQLAFRAGFCLARANRCGEAVLHYERALALKGDDLWSNNNLGDCHRREGRPDRALPLFEKAIGLAPKEIIPAKNRVYALIDLGQTKLARDLLKDLQRRHPDQPILLVQTAEAYAAEGKHSAALEWLARAAKAGFRDCEYLRSAKNLRGARENKSKEFARLCQ